MILSVTPLPVHLIFYFFFLYSQLHNLILSIEAQADKAVEDKDFDKAVDRYEEIIAIVKNTKCGSSSSEKAAEEKAAREAERIRVAQEKEAAKQQAILNKEIALEAKEAANRWVADSLIFI
jgi:hypothetical protein